jgi:hypothetical protein
MVVFVMKKPLLSYLYLKTVGNGSLYYVTSISTLLI